MTLKKIHLIITTLFLLGGAVPTVFFGSIFVGEVMAEIDDNTRHRLTQRLERLENRSWHIVKDFPAQQSYTPAVAEELIRLGHEIDDLKIKLGYTVGE